MKQKAQGFQILIAERTDDPRWQLAQRVASSAYLRSCPRLRDFLLYVTECALRDAPEDATEQQIGIHVFQRTAGYNSSEDSVVRTQARLLRQKLIAYFALEGAGEELILEIPKGQYLPVFHLVTTFAATEPPALDVPARRSPPETSVNPPTAVALNRMVGILYAFIVILLLGGFVTWGLTRNSGPAPDLERLWHPFFAGEPPLVIYSNGLFLREPDGALRWTSPDDPQTLDPRSQVVDRYTGVGEVVAIHELTHLFDVAHASFILKRSRLVTWDEARNKNLIFIGGPYQNQALTVVPSTSDFAISPTYDAPGIVNLHPKPGEPALYPRQEYPQKDYAIVALVPGAEPGKWMMVLSGLTTLGSEAATEFVCNPDDAGELLHAATTAEGTIHPFEAVIEIAVSSGVPVQARLLTVHVR